MSRRVLCVTLVGTAPLLMHSGSLLDPINAIGQALAAYHGRPRLSTADHAHIGDLEFAGSLWLDEEERPCVPARTVEAALRQAAERRGVDRRLRSTVFVEADAPLDFDGPRDLDALKRDAAFRSRSSVTVDGTRRMLTRPCFRRWAAPGIGIAFDDAVVARGEVLDLMIVAGDNIGIGAGRPRFGRFAVVPGEVERALPAA